MLSGKKLNVEVAFHYEANNDATSKTGRDASNQERAKKQARADAVQTIFDRAEAYEQVFKVIRCPRDVNCNGPYCWQPRDAMDGKKHRRIYDHQLKALVDHAQQGGEFTSHEDMAEKMKEELLREEQQIVDGANKSKRKRSFTDENGRQVILQLHNCLARQTGSRSTGHDENAPVSPWVDYPGYEDDALDEYYEYHCSRTRNETQKEHFSLARTLTRDHGYDLQHLQYLWENCEDGVKFFEGFGVLEGVAIRWLRDPKKFVKSALKARADEHIWSG